jgi:hypothetical protein
MQFQLDQGADMINNRYAALGALQSGAAMKALQNYGQQTALNNYFMPYMGMLGGLSAQGAQAGSAIAGVGSNFGNTAANINGQMGRRSTPAPRTSATFSSPTVRTGRTCMGRSEARSASSGPASCRRRTTDELPQRLEAAERKLAAREGRPGLTANVEALKAEIKKLKPKVRKQARQEAQSV